ncbi:hypothetical protein BH18VER1_BH18VER1_17210 [soil metagenome]
MQRVTCAADDFLSWELMRKFKLVIVLAIAGLTVTSYAQRPPRIAAGLISVELHPVATGLNNPLEFVSANDGSTRFFIVEQGGRIKLLKNGAGEAVPFLDISGQIKAGGETGLLGLAFHPGFANSASPGFRKFYTYQSEQLTGSADFTVPKAGGFDNQSVITEWQVSPGNADVADPTTRRDVLRINQPQANHNGGKIAFRPSDGYLYIALGDGGAGNDVGDGHTPNLGNGRDTSNVLGSILRIDPLAPSLTAGSADAVSANGRYRVPRTNPFVGAAGVDEIFAYGFRNPFRFSFDAATDRLIVGDVGQNTIEEVDIVERGRNYGWNRKEGSFLLNSSNGSISPDLNPNPDFTDPTLEYGHGDGISVIGGYVYRGTAVPALTGKYVFGDFRGPATGSGRLFYSDLAGGKIEELQIGLQSRPLGALLKAFGYGHEGELYVVTDSGGSSGGEILEIVPIPARPALVNLSTRARVAPYDNAVIAGFILTGSAPKSIVLRGLGPSLQGGGEPIPGRLLDPRLTLFDDSGKVLAANDDWRSSPQRQQLIDSGLAPASDRESAMSMMLQPGVYTAALRGVDRTSGIGLIELYDVEQDAPANAVNISTRSFAQTGDAVMIGGFIIGGSQSQRIIVRAIGPSLSARGITNPLQNPTLELVNSSGTTIAFNDNWRGAKENQIAASGLAPANDAESAIIRTLNPGNYTAIVRGAAQSTGVGLVEIYGLAP